MFQTLKSDWKSLQKLCLLGGCTKWPEQAFCFKIYLHDGLKIITPTQCHSEHTKVYWLTEKLRVRQKEASRTIGDDTRDW
ncbi:hypothetical protein BLX87_10770 [Bacillus sp. VT-16-64]|nr:hypothetical protein BLX87_10770 [Bacillus sp. VT-16-64]